MGSKSLNCGHCHWLHGGSYLIKKKQKEKKVKNCIYKEYEQQGR
jgi:hypothetical protein